MLRHGNSGYFIDRTGQVLSFRNETLRRVVIHARKRRQRLEVRTPPYIAVQPDIDVFVSFRTTIPFEIQQVLEMRRKLRSCLR